MALQKIVTEDLRYVRHYCAGKYLALTLRIVRALPAAVDKIRLGAKFLPALAGNITKQPASLSNGWLSDHDHNDHSHFHGDRHSDRLSELTHKKTQLSFEFIASCS